MCVHVLVANEIVNLSGLFVDWKQRRSRRWYSCESTNYSHVACIGKEKGVLN